MYQQLTPEERQPTPNAVPDNHPSVNFSLIQDPSVWSTAAAGDYPSMPDVWFGICAAIDALFPVSWLFLWVLARVSAPHSWTSCKLLVLLSKLLLLLLPPPLFSFKPWIGTALLSKSVMLPCKLLGLSWLTTPLAHPVDGPLLGQGSASACF
jgi:hypothetical protein